MNASEPHCPGESHALSVINKVATMPKSEGLKRCLPLSLNTYLHATVIKAARKLTQILFVFKSKQRLAALIKTLNPQDWKPLFPLSDSSVSFLQLSKLQL